MEIIIIGGSALFHGAPLLSLKVASRMVDMVFFASPEPSLGPVADQLKSKLLSFIWVPWSEVEHYIEKSDAVLMGPGFMRFKSESTPHGERTHVCDEVCQKTRDITKNLLQKFPNKKWVIDAGSLQTMDAAWIPANAILTPNEKEYQMLFAEMPPQKAAEKYNCVIVRKTRDAKTIVYSPHESKEIPGGNPGLTKGGMGDVLAGVNVAQLAKNDAFLSACEAARLVKKAADELYKKVGGQYNADDLADQIPSSLFPQNER